MVSVSFTRILKTQVYSVPHEEGGGQGGRGAADRCQRLFPSTKKEVTPLSVAEKEDVPCVHPSRRVAGTAQLRTVPEHVSVSVATPRLLVAEV